MSQVPRDMLEMRPFDLSDARLLVSSVQQRTYRHTVANHCKSTVLSEHLQLSNPGKVGDGTF